MQKQLAACGVKPQVVSDIADLQPLLERDGAAVIDGPECGAEATRALARQIFAEKTLAIPDAARVFEGGEFDHARDQARALLRAQPRRPLRPRYGGGRCAHG